MTFLEPLTEFCNGREIVFLSDVTTDLLTDFRETWKGRYDPATRTFKPKTQMGKKRCQESLKVFFHYALKAKWITEDPSANFSKIEVPDPDPQPYTEDEWGRILAQIEPTFPKIRRMVLAFVLVLKFAALRISDVARLENNHIKDLELQRRAKKNFQPVELPITDELLNALNGFEQESAVLLLDWQRRLGNGCEGLVRANFEALESGEDRRWRTATITCFPCHAR